MAFSSSTYSASASPAAALVTRPHELDWTRHVLKRADIEIRTPISSCNDAVEAFVMRVKRRGTALRSVHSLSLARSLSTSILVRSVSLSLPPPPSSSVCYYALPLPVPSDMRDGLPPLLTTSRRCTAHQAAAAAERAGHPVIAGTTRAQEASNTTIPRAWRTTEGASLHHV
jgi:hypothetical protein